MARRKQEQGKMDAHIDELLNDGVNAQRLFGQEGVFKQLKKRMAERIKETELTDHLGYEKEAPDSLDGGNSRIGKTTKTLEVEKCEVSKDIPLDLEGSFDLKLVRKYQTRWSDLDDRIIAKCAHGMTTREIQGHIEDLCGVAISPERVSRIADGVVDEAAAWQSRPLDAVNPILFIEALFVNVRDAGSGALLSLSLRTIFLDS
ncbi:MAG: hypothetical protein HOH43_20460 [Candidatus Latescibacteria bacterium]|nr:hypothetical protein [Candidatus Latescibacterota bacterium]